MLLARRQQRGTVPSKLLKLQSTSTTSKDMENPTAHLADINTTSMTGTLQITYALAAIMLHITLTINQPLVTLTLTMTNETVPTLADSGATDHCFINCKVFLEYKLFATPQHS